MYLSMASWSFVPWHFLLIPFYVLSLIITVRSFHIKLRQAIGLYFPTSVPFVEFFITRIVLPSTNHPGTSPTSIHSFKTAARTSCTAVKDFNQNPWILSVAAPFQSGIDLNFLLTSSFVIFIGFCFSDGIFSFSLSIHYASRLCSTFVLHIPFQNAVASSAFGGFVLSSLPSRFLKNLPWLVSKFLLSWNCFILLSYCFTLLAFAVILCFSSSITNVNPFLLSPYFWSSQSFSFFLSFFHLPANHASILLRSFLNQLISLRILLFQKGSFFFFAFDFFMPTSKILIAAGMTFLQCVRPVIFTCSNTLFILITSSLIFCLSPYFRFFSVLPKSSTSNAALNLKSLSLSESLKWF